LSKRGRKRKYVDLNELESKDIKSNDIPNKDKDSVIIDKINLKIIEKLLNNPDIKTSEIAQKLQIPLSTIQRRRSLLERLYVLKRNYLLDLKRFGLRIADISINVEQGKCQKIAKDIQSYHSKNIISTSFRIGDPETNLSFKIVYKNSNQLFNLIEDIKKNSFVSRIEWSESVIEEKNENISFIDLLNSD
jgi:DNA-binding Lrp family transcriptional regulator